jgi:hypothetical protein
MGLRGARSGEPRIAHTSNRKRVHWRLPRCVPFKCVPQDMCTARPACACKSRQKSEKPARTQLDRAIPVVAHSGSHSRCQGYYSSCYASCELLIWALSSGSIAQPLCWRLKPRFRGVPGAREEQVVHHMLLYVLHNAQRRPLLDVRGSRPHTAPKSNCKSRGGP